MRNPDAGNAMHPGRNPDGTFAKGNNGGPGNPLAGRIAKLRSALIKSITPADVRQVIAALKKKAIEGDTLAARVLLDRVLGPALPGDVIERLENLEKQLEDRQ